MKSPVEAIVNEVRRLLGYQAATVINGDAFVTIRGKKFLLVEDEAYEVLRAARKESS